MSNTEQELEKIRIICDEPLACEMILEALRTIRADPTISISDALDVGYHEWMK